MDFAMDNLGQLPNLLKSKFIQGDRSCQIRHNGSQLSVERKMKKITSLIAVILTLVGFAVIAEAQQPAKIPRVGFLRPVEAEESYVEAFRQGLKKLGYVEGKNIALEYRSGTTDQFPKLAAELVGLRVDVIVADGSALTRAAKKATSTIPIVMTTSTDPVGTGLIASLARPGGNVTGLSSNSQELGGKTYLCLRRSCRDSPAWSSRHRVVQRMISM